MPPSHAEALAENAILRGKLHNAQERNRRLLAALSELVCHHLGGHPGTDALLADLHDMQKPPAAETEGSHPPPTSPGTPPESRNS